MGAALEMGDGLLHEEATVQPSHGPQGSPQLCALDFSDSVSVTRAAPSLKQSRKLVPGTVRGQGQAWSPPDWAGAEEVDMRQSPLLHGPPILCLFQSVVSQTSLVVPFENLSFHFYCRE